MNKYTLNFNNQQLEELYQKREIPLLKNWTQKMSAVVCLIATITILVILFGSGGNYKSYISQLILAFSSFSTIILIQFRRKYFNIIHTMNCTIYMCTTIWTYVDKDFYHNIEKDFLNGYIQGLATFVYITGTRFLPKLFLITLLFINMAFCRGSDNFLAYFLQVSPLWLIFIYKIYDDERMKRQLFLSQQQEHVYKYIIQNVMPNGFYLVKFDKKTERIELHSSNQKPKILSYVKNTDDIQHLLKNTILAGDDVKLQNLLKSNSITWSDTLDGHLRRKIDQAFEWGEKRYIKLKDRNVIRSKQGTTSNDSDIGIYSIFNNSQYNVENGRPQSKNTFLNTEQDIQNTQNMQSQQIQIKKQNSQLQSNNLITIPQLSQNNLDNQSPTQLRTIRNKMKSYITITQNYVHSDVVLKDNYNNNSNGHIQKQNTINQKFQKINTSHSQQLISIQEVATNLLFNSSNVNAIQYQQNLQFKRILQAQSPNRSGLTKSNMTSAIGQNQIDKRVMMSENNQNTYTDLVEYFSAIYKKNDDNQYKLNLRLSTFYLNEIYGVISVEDESFKDKFLSKEKAYNYLIEIYNKTIKDINNLVVLSLYRMMRQNNNMHHSKLEDEQKYLNDNIFQMLKLKNKIDNYNQALQIINNRYPKKVIMSECQEFSLINELKPFFEICQRKAKQNQIKLFIDFSPSIIENENIFTSKMLLNNLLFNIIFNVFENTPQKGYIAIRIDQFDNNQQIKFKIYNTTTKRVDLQYFQNFHEPITIQALMSDIKNCDKPQIGLRLAHRILQRIGPTSKIEYSQNGSSNYDSLNSSFYNNQEVYRENNQQNKVQLQTLYSTFYIYRDMQRILSGQQPNIKKNNTYDFPKQQETVYQLQKNTPYQSETKNNLNQINQEASFNKLKRNKQNTLNNNNTYNFNEKTAKELAQQNQNNISNSKQFNMNSSDIVMDESNDSFKLWMKTRQFEEYNKSIPRMLNINKFDEISQHSFKSIPSQIQF